MARTVGRSTHWGTHVRGQGKGRGMAHQALEGLGRVQHIVAELRPELAQLLLDLVEALLRRALPRGSAACQTRAQAHEGACSAHMQGSRPTSC